MLGIDVVKSNFKAPAYRPYQEKALEKAVELFNSGKRTIVFELPTGLGKSLINMALALSFGSAFYVTPQLVLLEQLKNDKFFTLNIIEGRANYVCKENYLTCDVGNCKLYKNYSCIHYKNNTCEYWYNKRKAMNSRVAGMSISYLIVDNFVEKGFEKERELLVVDEAHFLDEWVAGFVEVSFSQYGIFRDIKIPREFSSTKKAVEWVEENMLPVVYDRLHELEETDPLTEKEAREYERLENFVRRYRSFIKDYQEDPRNWVFEVVPIFEKRKGVKRKIVFKPINVGKYCKELILDRGRYLVISSATILDIQQYCKDTGLDIADTALIRSSSYFPKENRKVSLEYLAGKMTFGEKKDNIRRAVKNLEVIMNKENGKGLIHCHSYGIANSIFNLIKSDYKNRIIFHNSDNRKEKFQEWLESEDKVFAGVSFTEGIDLLYDVCDWQALLKVPYPDTNDKRVSTKLKRKQWKWYFMRTLKEVIQSYGRGVRAEDDSCTFYVIDESFVDLVKKYNKYLPVWFKEVLT